MIRSKAIREATIFCIFAMALAGGLVPPGPAHAETSVECEFDQGQAATVRDGAYARETGEPLSFTIQLAEPGSDSAALDIGGKQTPLRVVRALEATHFLEVTVGGYLNLTTIYGGAELADTAGNGKGQRAVHSRHTGVQGSPVVAQYLGYCRTKA